MVKRILLILIFLGCASKPILPPEGEEKIIDRTGPSRPFWLTTPPKDTEDFYFSVGVKTSSPTLEGGETDARMDAGRKFVERLFGVEFAGMYKGIRKNYEKEIYDEITGKSGGKVAGARVREVYWEKYQRWAKGKVSYGYNVWILVEISKSATKKLLDDEIRKMNANILFARQTLSEVRNTDDKKIVLTRLYTARNKISAYDSPESTQIFLEIDKEIKKLEEGLKSVGIFISNPSVRGVVVNIFGAENFNCVEMQFSRGESRSDLINKAREKNLAYAFIEDIRISETSGTEMGYFIFAHASGRFDMVDTSKGVSVFSIAVNEKGGGTSFDTAVKNAINFVERRLSKELPSKIKTLFEGTR